MTERHTPRPRLWTGGHEQAAADQRHVLVKFTISLMRCCGSCSRQNACIRGETPRRKVEHTADGGTWTHSAAVLAELTASFATVIHVYNNPSMSG